MRSIATLLAWTACAACAAPEPGQPLTQWERGRLAEDEAPSEAAPREVPATLTWTALGDDAPLVFSEAGAGLASERVIWLRARARCAARARDPIVFTPKTYVGFAAYLEGRIVSASPSYRYASGTPWYAVPLDCAADDGAALVVFRLSSRYTQVGFPQPPRTGERAEFIEALVRQDAPRIALAILFMIIGLAAGALALGRVDRRALVGLSVYALSLAGWTLFHTRTKQLWLPWMELWFAVWWVTVPLTAAGGALFVDAVFGAGERRLLRVMGVGLGGVAALAALSLISQGQLFFVAAIPVFVAGRALTVVASLLAAARLARLSYRGDREALLFSIGLSVALVTVVRDIALSLHWIEGADTWTQFGYAALAAASVLIVRRRMTALRERVVQYAASLDRHVRERDLLMRDLHDGLGGIVTNVRMLAERGADGDAERVLPSIAALASDGITELRTLIFGFDDLPQSWRQLAAELRRAGSMALESRGLAHDFELEEDPDAPKPELALTLDLVRVHREALTNAVKHAHEANRVRVRVRVGRDSIELEVVDDGVAGGRAQTPSGVGLGRGIESMRSRARALGGELDFDPASPTKRGTRVSFRVPLAAV